jgi:hypothetical protein
VIHEVVGALVASGGACELAGKNGRPAWCAEYAGGVRVAEVDSALGQVVDVWGNSPWGFSKATDPIVHVVDRKKEDVRSIGRDGRSGHERHQDNFEIQIDNWIFLLQVNPSTYARMS